MERVLRCIDACAPHACTAQPCDAAAQPLPPLLPAAALRTLRMARRALHAAPSRLPTPALASAVVGELAARLGGVHDVASRRVRLNVALVCVVLDLVLGVAAGAALLAHAAPAEAGVHRATALLLRHLPSRGCALHCVAAMRGDCLTRMPAHAAARCGSWAPNRWASSCTSPSA
jgi:hypothetical protein